MRLIVILSPTNAYGTKMEYSKLRKFLISDGYLRIGTDVFERVATDRKSAQKHIRRLRKNNIATGNVRIIQLTEKQYKNIIYLKEEKNIQEEYIGSNCNIMIG